MRHVASLVVLLTAVTLVGCVDPPVAAAPASGATASPEIVATAADSAARPSDTRPLLLYVFKDRSWSANSTATPAVTMDDLNALVAAVANHGGEIGVGEVCARSFVNLTRLRIDESPTRPIPPAATGNPYLQREALAPYQRALGEYHAAVAARDAVIAADTERFIAAAWPRISAPNTCGASDVAGAVERGLLALGEPATAWSRPPRKALGLISDIQHNVGKWTVVIPDDVEVHAINGIGSKGPMANLPTLRLWEGLAGFIRDLRLSN